MPSVANAVSTYNARGIRENLTEIISRVAQEETPVYSTIGRDTATATRHEWQTQTLTAPSATNAAPEGNEFVGNAPNPTVRVGNLTQIMTKEVVVTGTMRAVATAGRRDELNYQRLIRGLELKRDIEAMLCSNNASSVGSSSGGRLSAGMAAWITTNVSKSTDGVNGGYLSSTGLVSARTNGTLRTFAKSQVDAVMASAFDNGGRPKLMVMRGALKNAFSNFAGISELRTDTQGREAVILGGADGYISNFGKLLVVPSISSRDRDVLFVDPAAAKVAVLRPITAQEIAKTGDSYKEMLVTELTLRVDNQAAHGIVTDVTPST